MIKFYISIIALVSLVACSQYKNTSARETEQALPDKTAMLIDSILYFRHHFEKTDILSRHLPDITREQAIEMQLAMLKKELATGAHQIGWKMGGTITDDSTAYDPLFGYILGKNLMREDSMVSAENFPGGQVMVEGEIGFVLKNDFENGVKSMEALKEGIDYVVSAVEFAQATAIPINDDPETLTINHIMASGMGHAGLIIGTGKINANEFDMESETVKCFINGKLVTEGISSRVYGSPLYALYSLANILPKYGTHLKKGDVVVTGSLFDNPTIDNTCQVRLEYSTLGNITFNME